MAILHLIPDSFRSANLDLKLLGFTHKGRRADGVDNFLDSHNNIMLVHRHVQVAAESGRITFVPTSGNELLPLEREWRVHIVDQALLGEVAWRVWRADGGIEREVLWADVLAVPTVEFLDKRLRPADRAVFFHVVWAVMLAKVTAPMERCLVGWEAAYGLLVSGKLWPNPGQFVHRDLLLALDKSAKEDFDEGYLEQATFRTFKCDPGAPEFYKVTGWDLKVFRERWLLSIRLGRKGRSDLDEEEWKRLDNLPKASQALRWTSRIDPFVKNLVVDLEKSPSSSQATRPTSITSVRSSGSTGSLDSVPLTSSDSSWDKVEKAELEGTRGWRANRAGW